MAFSYCLSLQRAAPRFRWYAGTFESISMALAVSFAFYQNFPCFPTAFPLRFRKSLLSFSEARSSPLSQANSSSFHFLRWRQALAWSRYLSLVLGMLLASSRSSLYCFLALKALILAAFSWLVSKIMGLPSSKSSSSTSMIKQNVQTHLS